MHTCIQYFNSKEKDDIQAVQAITNQRLEKLQVTKNNIKNVQQKQKEIFDRKHACPSGFVVEEKKSRRKDG